MIHAAYMRLLQLAFLSALIACALGINYISAANTWVGPTALPPGNNTYPPLNIGTTNQVKDTNLSVGHSANTATDYGLVAYGKIRSTIGGVEFPDGTVQTSAALVGGGKLVAIRQYAASATWTKPVGLSYVLVEVWGGGGGGSDNSGALEGTGGTSSFGSYVSATGGINSTSPGTGVSGDINLVGGDGGAYTAAGASGSLFGASSMGGSIGGSAPRGGGTSKAVGKVPGGGGAGASWSNAGGVPFSNGAGGAAGGYAMKLIDKNTLQASESVTVGAGGTGGATAAQGRAGGAGMVIVYEYQ